MFPYYQPMKLHYPFDQTVWTTCTIHGCKDKSEYYKMSFLSSDELLWKILPNYKVSLSFNILFSVKTFDRNNQTKNYSLQLVQYIRNRSMPIYIYW